MHNYHIINRKVALLVTILLLVLAGFQSFQLGQKFLYGGGAIRPLTQQAMHQENSTPRLDLPDKLFGSVGSAIKPHKLIRKTRLNLTLIGVLSQQKNALAIIKQDNKEKIYKINDEINAVAYVKAIYSKYIVINHNGNDEKLSIKHKAVPMERAKKERKPRKKKMANAQKINDNSIDQNGVIVIETRDKLKLKKILGSPEKMLSVISVQPNYRDGDLYGFKLNPGKEKVLFKKIGLQSGDVILEVNGISLDNWFKLVPARLEMSKQNFDLVIKRKNRMHFLSINLK
ncbi:type II secretion system protein N [Candidatus Thiodubiliella endoseptemdiera]|uniref:type II secretion system protein N n=1 Tax=Candidatus Thiodubiliella endoseptemdiera TaxID=2738886 RepID=UPI0034DFBFF3